MGRAVLIDWASWAEEKGIKYRADSKHCIRETELDEIAKENGIEFRVGDILLVRTGWIKWYNTSNQEQRINGTKARHEYIGVDSSRSSVEWLWNHHFAAVAADNMAFEAWPASDPAIRQYSTPVSIRLY